MVSNLQLPPNLNEIDVEGASYENHYTNALLL